MKNETNRGNTPHRQVNIDTTRAYRDPRRTAHRPPVSGEMDVSGAYRSSRTSQTRSNVNQTNHRTNQTHSTASRATNARKSSGQTSTKQTSARKQEAKKRKKKTKHILRTILILLVLTPVIVLGGGYLYINYALSGSNAGMGNLSSHVNTPKEFKGDVVNFLVCGIDFEEGRTHALTDMIMYVNFDVKNKKINMLQIPRDTYVGGELANNGKINGVASKNGGIDISLLANQIYKMFKLPIDYYLTIDMDSLKSIVDTFGGIEVYVPRDMEYKGSKLSEGYQTMNGAAAEFFVRCRHGDGYATGDFARLEMQRFFYSGLFNRLRSMTPNDIFKLFPVFLTYMKTDMDVMDMASVGVSALTVPSQNIMMCRLPEYAGAQRYNNQSVNVVAEPETADLLNTYFRSYGEPVSAQEFEIPQWPAAGQLHDAAINFMGDVDSQAGITSGNIDVPDSSEQQPAA